MTHDRYALALALDARFQFLEDPGQSVAVDRAAEVSDGRLSDLLIGVKANIAVRGQGHSAGLRGRAAATAPADARVVATLRGLGAQMMSRLTMDAAALGAATEANGWRVTDNPRAPGHSVGGSSGGSAAAVASGAVDAALGTDTLGSVRIPAAYCGVLGLKPGRGVVPLDGVFPLAPALDTVGFLAQRTEALRELVAVFGAKHTDRPWTVRRLDDPVVARHEAVAAAEAVLARLGMRGAPMRIAGWPVEDLRKAAFACMLLDARETLAGLRDLPSPVTRALGYGASLSPDDAAAAREVCARAVEGLIEALEPGVILLTPTTPEPAFERGARPPVSQADFTAIANLAGVPALAVPMGSDGSGRPVSVQLIGAQGSELALLDIADTLLRTAA
ncbi:amidase family protein [Tropicimonas sp. S265A]|uniref:amidase family protein n=1 Tax=Tropicimonas sp. S265A TaxID=3415134 RepID=UPI003C7DCB74